MLPYYFIYYSLSNKCVLYESFYINNKRNNIFKMCCTNQKLIILFSSHLLKCDKSFFLKKRKQVDLTI